MNKELLSYLIKIFSQEVILLKDIEYISSALSEIKKEVWAKYPLLIPTPEPEWADDLFGMKALQWMLVEARIPENCFRIVNNGNFEPHRPYSRPIIIGGKTATYVLDGTKAAAALNNGSSIIFSALEEFWSPVKILCKNLSKQLGTKVSAFSVVTPARASGFVPHVDQTEQLVIQCQGKKSWKVYDIFIRGNQGSAINLDNVGSPVLEANITEGQMLYLPQGAPHMAQTSNELSAHITLTFEPVTTGNWLYSALRELIEQDEDCLTSLPPFYYEEPHIYLDQLDKNYKDILGKLSKKVREVATKDIQKASKITNGVKASLNKK